MASLIATFRPRTLLVVTCHDAGESMASVADYRASTLRLRADAAPLRQRASRQAAPYDDFAAAMMTSLPIVLYSARWGPPSLTKHSLLRCVIGFRGHVDFPLLARIHNSRHWSS